MKRATGRGGCGTVNKAVSVAAVLCCLTGFLGAATLISGGATWNYDDSGTDRGTAWMATDFDDGAWASGPAQLGYGENDQTTTLSFGDDPDMKHVTYYFRHRFTVADPSAYDTLWLWIVRDDGCVVYLNGSEVLRSNMPADDITYTTPASGGAADENSWQTFTFDPGLLVAGPNLIAVEVHQANLTSSDVSFDLRQPPAMTGAFAVPQGSRF